MFLIACNRNSDAEIEVIPPLQTTSSPTISKELTATYTPYHQDLPIPTPSPFLTTSPTITILPTATNASDQIVGNIAVILQLWNTEDDRCVQVLDDQFKFLYDFPGCYFHLSSFSTDGCQLIGVNYYEDSGSFVIRKLNLQGEELQSTIVLLKEPEDNSRIYQYVLSPTGRWLAYKRVDQIQMSKQDAGVQDVRLLKVGETDPQDGIQLTDQGGAHTTTMTWSADSHYLAYTDYDKNRIQQIFLFDPDEGREYQITQFSQEMKDHLIMDLKWSPNSQSLAFLSTSIDQLETTGEITNEGTIGIMSIPTFTLKWLDFKESTHYQLFNSGRSTLATIYWDNQGKTLMIPIEIKMSENEDDALIWYDIETGKVVHTISIRDIFNREDYSFAFPLDDIDQVGIWFSDTVYVYDRISQEISIQEKDYFLSDNSTFLIAPNGPIDPVQCLR